MCVEVLQEIVDASWSQSVKFPKRSSVSNVIIVKVLDNMGLPTHGVYVSAVEILLTPITSVK